ncbi:MAG TPA: hypothetical protein VFB22_04995 [Candidatus Baltobacteraceae bacterium]|nr:hypothetical protein [Candidatus Baltobacteraceae bacterium]
MRIRKNTQPPILHTLTREEVAAIVGPPMFADPVFLAALSGKTREQARAFIRREGLGDVDPETNRLELWTHTLMRKVGYPVGNPPKMLRAGRLVDRPALSTADVARRFPTGLVTVTDAMAITGQTLEEVHCDLLARRLWAHRDVQPAWRIFAEQFGEDFVTDLLN